MTARRNTISLTTLLPFGKRVGGLLFLNVIHAVLICALITLPVPRVAAQAPNYTPYQHKALFLFNFAKYTEWPKAAFPNDEAPFQICILGTDPFGKDIDIIRGKAVKNRKVEIKCISSIDEAKDCQLLFIASSEKANLTKILKALEKTSVLTIAESDGFLEAHGMINLVTEKKTGGTQTVAFEINLAAAQKANLKLDAQLLKLAKQVKT